MFINKQSRVITDALKTSSIILLIKEVEMTPVGPLLNHRQRKYVLRALKLSSSNPGNQLLLLTLQYNNGNVQSDQYSKEDLSWIHSEVTPVNLT